MRQVWRCYSVTSSMMYLKRDVFADSFEEAEAQYTLLGNNIFVWAEPIEDSEAAIGDKPSKDRIKQRLQELGKIPLDSDLTIRPQTLVAKPGPRKPAPAIPPEIHATKPFDPVAAWEAVKALSKGS